MKLQSLVLTPLLAVAIAAAAAEPPWYDSPEFGVITIRDDSKSMLFRCRLKTVTQEVVGNEPARIHVVIDGCPQAAHIGEPPIYGGRAPPARPVNTPGQ